MTDRAGVDTSRERAKRPATDPLLYIAAWLLTVATVVALVVGATHGAVITGAGTGFLHGVIIGGVWSRP